MGAYRHLPSALHPFACRSLGLPWRSFTMSCPLQPGVGLLRRLRPPVRTLAFSRPPLGGKAAWGFPSSGASDVVATRSCLLYAGWLRDNAGRFGTRPAPHHPFWVGWFNHLHPLLVTTLRQQVPRVSIGRRTGRSSASWLAGAERLSAGFRPQGLPTPDACCVVLAPLSQGGSSGAIVHAVKGRAPKSSLDEREELEPFVRTILFDSSSTPHGPAE